MPPKLAPPGAGIPFIHRIALRLLVLPFVANRSSWENSQAEFSRTTKKIRHELENLSQEQMEKKILVPPIMGLEDSSRYWSITMTLDHILIVARQISQIVKELDAGRTPSEVTSIAAMKPSGALLTAEVLKSFQTFCDSEFPAILPSLKNRHSKLRFRHPWFGEMKAQAWYWLLATHNGIHLKQIRAIKKDI